MQFPTFDPMLIFTLFMAVGALSGVTALAMALLRRDRQADRLKAVTERRRQLAMMGVDATKAKARHQPKKKKSATEQLVEKFKLLQADRARLLKRKLAAAGWRESSAPALFVAASIGLPIVFGLLAGLWASGPAIASKPFMVKLMVPVLAALFGFLLPRILLSNTIQKRRKAISKTFPDALDLMVICVEAGLSAEAAFNRVTEEMIATAPITAEEFGLVAAELAFLPDRRQAYENMAERTGLPSMKSLSTTLLQSEKYGTPVASGLKTLADENRESRMAAAEKKAAALPAQLTVPMILFFLPVLFMVIAGPAAIRISGGGQ